MTNTLQIFATVGGSVGLVLFIFFALFRRVAISFFERINLSREHSYKVVRLFMVLTFTFALACVLALIFFQPEPMPPAKPVTEDSPKPNTKHFASDENLRENDGMGFSIDYPSAWYSTETSGVTAFQPKPADAGAFADVEVSYSYLQSSTGFTGLLDQHQKENPEWDAHTQIDQLLSDYNEQSSKADDAGPNWLGRTVREVSIQSSLGPEPKQKDNLDIPVMEHLSEGRYVKSIQFVQREFIFPPTDHMPKILELTCSSPDHERTKASEICDSIFKSLVIVNPEYFGD